VDPTLRHADPVRDGASCAAIYAPYVTSTTVSFEDLAPTAEELAARIERTERTYPWLVLQDSDRIIGFAYAGRHHERAAYRWAADVAVYVDASHHGRGAGRMLYSALLDLLRRQGLRMAWRTKTSFGGASRSAMTSLPAKSWCVVTFLSQSASPCATGEQAIRSMTSSRSRAWGWSMRSTGSTPSAALLSRHSRRRRFSAS